MDRVHYNEMINKIGSLCCKNTLSQKNIYFFGHCNATEECIDLLLSKKYSVSAILDNNSSKHGMFYKNIPIKSPQIVSGKCFEDTIILILSKAYESMKHQLHEIGYKGEIVKIVDFNSYAEYSLDSSVIQSKTDRLKRGMISLKREKEKYNGYFRIYCPFCALGDVYNVLAYLPHYIDYKKIDKYVVYVVGEVCFDLAKMFGIENVEFLSQNEMDERVQANMYMNEQNAIIAHNDKPYAIYLQKALKIKKITHSMLYKYGVFSLSKDCQPYIPAKLDMYNGLNSIRKGKSVILSPYAKSVASIPDGCWIEIIKHYSKKKYDIYTNTVGDEKELPGTLKLQVPLSQFQSVVEQAGTFIGLRSGLCDVIQVAKCTKIALYPNCYYSDTEWKVADIFYIDGWENIVV